MAPFPLLLPEAERNYITYCGETDQAAGDNLNTLSKTGSPWSFQLSELSPLISICLSIVVDVSCPDTGSTSIIFALVSTDSLY